MDGGDGVRHANATCLPQPRRPAALARSTQRADNGTARAPATGIVPVCPIRNCQRLRDSGLSFELVRETC